jgi:hypothetical protein
MVLPTSPMNHMNTILTLKFEYEIIYLDFEPFLFKKYLIPTVDFRWKLRTSWGTPRHASTRRALMPRASTKYEYWNWLAKLNLWSCQKEGPRASRLLEWAGGWVEERRGPSQSCQQAIQPLLTSSSSTLLIRQFFLAPLPSTFACG